MKARDAFASFARPSVARMLRVLTLSAGCLLAGSVSTALAQFDAVVVQDEVDMRAGAGRSYYALGTIGKDQQVQVLRVRYGWYQVLAPKGVSLFVEKDQLELDLEGQTATITAAQAPAFLAHPQGPGASTQEATQLKRGAVVTVLGEEGGFVRIEPMGETLVYLPPGALRRVMDHAPVAQPVNASAQEAAPVVDLVVAKEPTAESTGGEWWQAHDVHPRVQKAPEKTVADNQPAPSADMDPALEADIAEPDTAIDAEAEDELAFDGPVIEPFGSVAEGDTAKAEQSTPEPAVQTPQAAPVADAAPVAEATPAAAQASSQNSYPVSDDETADPVASAFAMALADRTESSAPRATNAMNTSQRADVKPVLNTPIQGPDVSPAPAQVQDAAPDVRIDPTVEQALVAASEDKWADADAADADGGADASQAQAAAAVESDLDPEIEKQITAVDPALRAVERDMIRSLTQPLELQPIDKLTQRYSALAGDNSLSRADQWIIRTRLAQLSRNAQLQAAVEKLSVMRSERSADSVREEIANKPEPKVVYDHVGILLGSGVYDGIKLPQLLRLVHPQSQRTLGYVKPSDAYDMAAVLGQRVGIVGELIHDPQVGRDVIDPTRVDALGE